MKKIYAAALVSLALIVAATGSPILRVIQTKAQLAAINATVECETHRFSDGTQMASFTVTWQTKRDADDEPLYIIFSVFKEDGIHGPQCGRMRVIFKPDRLGVIRAEFDVAVEELRRSQLIFMTPQIWADTLVLKTAADGFPDVPDEVDPFATPEEANKPRLDNPLPGPSRDGANDYKPQP